MSKITYVCSVCGCSFQTDSIMSMPEIHCPKCGGLMSELAEHPIEDVSDENESLLESDINYNNPHHLKEGEFQICPYCKTKIPEASRQCPFCMIYLPTSFKQEVKDAGRTVLLMGKIFLIVLLLTALFWLLIWAAFN